MVQSSGQSSQMAMPNVAGGLNVDGGGLLLFITPTSPYEKLTLLSTPIHNVHIVK